MMKEIRIHGRGGQGVVTASELIAISSFFEGKQAQAFPSFGVERTGAPIEAYVRISNEEIRTREQVQNPNILIIQDSTLLDSVNVAHGCDENTLIIINSSKNKSELNLDAPEKNIYVFDATKIAINIIGRNIVNTVMLGGIAKATGLFSLSSIKQAIKQKFEKKGSEIIEKNIKAVEAIYNS